MEQQLLDVTECNVKLEHQLPEVFEALQHAPLMSSITTPISPM
jgi:hypothetical protein